MANNYTEHPELRFELNNPLMERIVELRERGYAEFGKYADAPANFADAMDSYDRILDVVGELAGTTIAENAESVDEEGPHLENNRVRYASGTERNYEAMKQAGLY